MTLTSIMPSLRRSMPDPIDIDSWPEATHATTTDIVVSGISMLQLTDVCETPCIHTATAVIPGTHGRPSPRDEATVVVTTVTAVVRSVDGGRIAVLDACLDHVPAVWAQARLVGRASTAHTEPVRVVSDLPVGDSPTMALPADLRPGDLVAIPCAGMVLLRDVRVPENLAEGGER